MRRQQQATGMTWKGRETEWRRDWIKLYYATEDGREKLQRSRKKAMDKFREKAIEQYGSWLNYLKEKKRLREERLGEAAEYSFII